jgi:hypothetical protein
VNKWIIAPVALGLLVCANPARAQDDPKAIIEKSIKAYGGKEKLEKYKAFVSKAKGTIDEAGGINFVQELSFQAPNQFRVVMDVEVMGQKATVKVIFDGEKGWISVNNMTMDAPESTIREFKDASHLMEVTKLTGLGDKKYKLESLGESKVEDKPVIGIRVTTEGQRDVNLFFDKETYLILKTERRAVTMTEQEVTEERINQSFGEVEGLKIPKKVLVLRDGKKYVESEETETKVLDSIDKSEFAKP